jgi:hypothetical protein
MRWAGYIASMGDMRNLQKTETEYLKKRAHSETDRGIISK